MSTLEKNKRKKKEPSPTTPNPSLPYDLLVSCLARVSRLYYPNLSLVSKNFRSLLASPEIYKARSLLGHTESCLYVCVGRGSDLRWFTLCQRPDKIRPVLAKVPIPSSPRAKFSSLVAVGSNIYNIAGSCDYMTDSASSSVSILDCTSHTWREGPSLRGELTYLSTCVVDLNIYVVGCGRLSSKDQNSFQVFDTTKQIWDPKPIPCRKAETFFTKTESACIDGKLHVNTSREELTYNPKECRWDVVKHGIGYYLSSNAYCEIGNVLYSVWCGRFMWYDTKISYWRNLKGLEPLCDGVRLADYGGKMAVFHDDGYPLWENHDTMIWCLIQKKKKMIWCAVIELEKRKSCDEMWGEVEWLDNVLPTP